MALTPSSSGYFDPEKKKAWDIQKAEQAKIRAETRAKREAEKQRAIQEAYSLAQKRATTIRGDKKTRAAAEKTVKFLEERYTPETLGKSPETQKTQAEIIREANVEKGFVSIDPRVKLPPTPKERASVVAQQIKLRQAIPISIRQMSPKKPLPINQETIVEVRRDDKSKTSYKSPRDDFSSAYMGKSKEDIFSQGKEALSELGQEFIISPLRGAKKFLAETQRQSIEARGLDIEKAPGWVKNFISSSPKENLVSDPDFLTGVTFGFLPGTSKGILGSVGKAGTKLAVRGFLIKEYGKALTEPSYKQAFRAGTLLIAPTVAKEILKIPNAFKSSEVNYEGFVTEKKVTFVGEGKLKGTAVKSVLVAEPEKTTLFVRSKQGLTKTVFDGEPIKADIRNTITKRTLLTEVSQGGSTFATAIETPITKLKYAGNNVKLDLAYSDIFQRNIKISPEVTKITEIDPYGKNIKYFGVEPAEISFGKAEKINPILDISKTKAGIEVLEVKPPRSSEISFYDRFGKGSLEYKEPSKAYTELSKLARSRKAGLYFEILKEKPKPEIKISPSKLKTAPEIRLGEFPEINIKRQTIYPLSMSGLSKESLTSTTKTSIKPFSETVFDSFTKPKIDIINIEAPVIKPRAITLSKTSPDMKLDTMLITKTIASPRVAQPYIRPPPFKFREPPTDKPIFFLPPFIEEEELKKKKKGRAYLVYLKRRGKFKKASMPLSLGAALDIGAKKAVGTLGATFKIEPVDAKPLDIKTGGEFTKYRNYFRSYKIKKGRREPLNMTFIQKRGTRLGSLGEVTEIQQARRSLF